MATRKPYCYEHPRPGVSVDIVIVRDREGVREVLLIQRRNDPFAGMWALPGGFVDIDETVEAAAKRELEEETGLTGVRLRQVGVFSKVDRDPRGRTISVAFAGTVGMRKKVRAGDDAGNAQWKAVDALPRLAFDHRAIIRAALAAE